MAQRGSGSALGLAVGASLLGVGVALLLRPAQAAAPGSGSPPAAPPPPVPPAERPSPVLEATGNTGIVPTHLREPDAPAAEPQEAEVAVFWSRSPIVLDEVLDPYNPQLEALRIAAMRRQGIPEDSVAGALYNGVRRLIGAVPVLGPIVIAGYEILTSVAAAVVGESKGGWGSLRKDQRQRAVVLGAVGSEFSQRSPFPSQIFDPSAPRTKPVRYGGIDSPEYRAAYARWLRRYLIETARAAEFERITRTDEDAMLPRDVIATLIDVQLWPPPLEPMPLTLAEFRARYAGTQNPAQWFVGFDDSLIERDNPETATVYQTLRRQYEADAERFRAAIARIGAAPEILQLMREQGSVPRLGSLANPGPGETAPAFAQAIERPSDDHVGEYRIGYLRGLRGEATPRAAFSVAEGDFYYQLGLSDGGKGLPPLWS